MRTLRAALLRSPCTASRIWLREDVTNLILVGFARASRMGGAYGGEMLLPRLAEEEPAGEMLVALRLPDWATAAARARARRLLAR